MKTKEKSGKKKEAGSDAPANDAKGALKAAKSQLDKFCKKHGINPEKVPSKYQEEFDRLQRAVDKATKGAKKGKEEKSAKKKDREVNGAGRNTKYTYPKGMDDPDERKKYRAKMRSEAKKAEGGSKKEKIAKPSKEEKSPKKDKGEKISKPEKPSKDAKKKSKKK